MIFLLGRFAEYLLQIAILLGGVLAIPVVMAISIYSLQQGMVARLVIAWVLSVSIIVCARLAYLDYKMRIEHETTEECALFDPE